MSGSSPRLFVPVLTFHFTLKGAAYRDICSIVSTPRKRQKSVTLLVHYTRNASKK